MRKRTFELVLAAFGACSVAFFILWMVVACVASSVGPHNNQQQNCTKVNEADAVRETCSCYQNKKVFWLRNTAVQVGIVGGICGLVFLGLVVYVCCWYDHEPKYEELESTRSSNLFLNGSESARFTDFV